MHAFFRKIIIGLVLSLSCFAKCTDATAQDTSEAEKRQPRVASAGGDAILDMFHVFLAVDEDMQPFDDYYHISEQLYEIIRAMMKDDAEFSHGWRILKARYTGTLGLNPLTQRMRVENFKIVYDIELNDERASIRLPKMPLQAEGAVFENRTIQPILRKDDPTFEFQLENRTKGVHKLELSLAPVPEIADTLSRIEIAIPKVPDSKLELSVPRDAPPITVTNSLGAVKDPANASETLKAEIGPSERLSFSWLDEPGRGTQETVELEQYFRLQAQANGVWIRSMFKYKIAPRGRLRQLVIATDPKLQLFGQYRCDEAEFEGEPSPDADGFTRLVFKNPVSDQITVRADFVFGERFPFSGIGKLRLPVLNASGVKITTSWLGVSYDPVLLECDLPPSSITTENFRQKWDPNGETAPPLFAYDLATVDPDWTMAIRTRNPEHRIEQLQSVMFQDEEAKIKNELNLNSSGETFQHRLRIPAELEIDRIDALDSLNQPCEIRWVVSDAVFPDEMPKTGTKTCSIFFKRPLSGKYAISLEARQPLMMGRIFTIPTIVLEDAIYDSMRFALYRDHKVLADCAFDETEWTGLAAQSMPGWKTAFPDSVPLGLFDAVRPDSYSKSEAINKLTVNVRPNVPEVSGWQLVSLGQPRNEERWDVSLDFHWNIREGELDLMRFKTEETLFGLKSEPPMAISQSGQYILIRPGKPFSGECDFTLKFQIPGTAESIRIPKLRYEGIAALEQYVHLPKSLSNKEIDWEIRHLVPAEENAVEEIFKFSKSVSPFSRAQILIYHATGQDYGATIQHRGQQPRAQLNDISLFFQKTGEMFGVSSFLLNAYGAESCVLSIPDKYELIHVTSGGITTKPDSLGKGRWRIELWPNSLPQRIDVVFTGSLDLESVKPESFFSRERNISKIPFPKLEAVLIEQTMWSIAKENKSVASQYRYSVDQFPRVKNADENDHENRFRQAESANELPEILYRQNMVRLDALSSLMQSVSLPATNESTEEIKRWYSYWGKEWWELKNELDALERQQKSNSERDWRESFFFNGIPSDTTIGLLGSPVNALQKPQDAIRLRYEVKIDQLNLKEMDKEFASSEGFPVTLYTIWRMGIPENTQFLFGVSEGAIDHVEVTSLSKPWSLTESGIVFHSLVAAVLFMLIILARRSHLYQFFSEYPYFCGVAIAICAWSVLGLNALGTLILLLTFIAWIWPIWRKRGKSYIERDSAAKYY